MAHSFIEAHETETLAFEHFARARSEGLVHLIDTYDTERAAAKAVELAKRLAQNGIHIRGVRLDSGDLADHARRVRRILDAGGLEDAIIFASGGLDEDQLAVFTRDKVPIDGFGIGTSLTTSSDAPALDCAYKLQEYDGIARRKLSSAKANWPGRKQVWRRFGEHGKMAGDLVAPAEEQHDGVPLLVPVMRAGKRIALSPALTQARRHAAEVLHHLPPPLAALEAFPYPVTIADGLRRLADECDRRIAPRRPCRRPFLRSAGDFRVMRFPFVLVRQILELRRNGMRQGAARELSAMLGSRQKRVNDMFTGRHVKVLSGPRRSSLGERLPTLI